MNLTPNNKAFLLPIKRFLNASLGIDLIRYPSPEFSKKIKLFDYLSIDLVLDVGANIGQYASELRASGYKEKIYSFEPVSTSYNYLRKIAKKDDKWEVFPFALGDCNEHTQMFVTENLVSSSLYEPSEKLEAIESRTKVIEKENIEVKTLDSIFDSMKMDDKSIFLKMDVQGFESNVISGAKQHLSHIKAIQLEMPLEKTYNGGGDFYELDTLLRQNEFKLISIDSGYYNPENGFNIEVDGIYCNTRFDFN